MFKYEFKFEQNRKGPWTCVKVTSLNRLDIYKFLGTGINSFGYIFNSVELFEIPQKKNEKGLCATGPKRPQCNGPGRKQPTARRQRVPGFFKPDGRGPASVRERGARVRGG